MTRHEHTWDFRQMGFTILEITIALGLLIVVMGLVAQVGFESMRDRWRSAARRDALELAANTLEAARACSWEELTPEWAGKQQPPEVFGQRLSGLQLMVTVEPEGTGGLSKLVTVIVKWNTPEGTPARPVELVGVFSARSAGVPGGEK
jgi:type II secretory pathway pseudopilin PulG